MEENVLDVIHNSKENRQMVSWEECNNLAVSHDKAMAVAGRLQKITDNFFDDINEARKALFAARKKIKNECDASIAESEKIFKKECDDLDKHLAKNFTRLESMGKSLSDVDVACKAFVKSLPPKYTSSVNTAQKQTDELANKKKNFDDSVAELMLAYGEFKTECVEEYLKKRNDRDAIHINKMKQEYAAVEAKYKAELLNIAKKNQTVISNHFNMFDIANYYNSVSKPVFDLENYQSPKTIPEYVYMGNIGVVFQDTNYENDLIVQGVKTQTKDYCCKDSDEYAIELPYAQRFLDGISLMITHSSEDRKFVKSLMQPLLVKCFMAFPAGKLEATIIDPLDLGLTFTDMPYLVKQTTTSRIIDTKIWSSQSEIESVISTLLLRLTNLTQSYGNDHASRLKNETIRALAITDFPSNFSDTALRDLQSIIRMSTSLGVVVLLSVNEQELNRLWQRNASLVEEILSNVVVTKVENERLVLSESKSCKIYLNLDLPERNIQDLGGVLSNIGLTGENSPENKKRITLSEMYGKDVYSSDNWFNNTLQGLSIPIGVEGANKLIKMTFGLDNGHTEHHALVAGLSGAGKSSFLNTLITSTMISYRPEEVQMYILDFKEGVEFNGYLKYRLPSLRSVATNSDKEFALMMFQELEDEFINRSEQFKKYDVLGIDAYNAIPGVTKFPKLILIFDEIQELFIGSGNDSIVSDCLNIIRKIVAEGRACGIHLVFASQDFRNCSGIASLFSLMSIRVAIKGTDASASSVLDANNTGYKSLVDRDPGAAIFNNGAGSAENNTFFQIAYQNPVERKELLSKLDEYYSKPEQVERYKDYQTRYFLSSSESNPNNSFNKMISGVKPYSPISKKQDGYGLLLGMGISRSEDLAPIMTKERGDNLLVATNEVEVALSIFVHSALSILHEDICNKANSKIYLVDLSDDKIFREKCSLEHLANCFPGNINRIGLDGIENMVDELTQVVNNRYMGLDESSERIFIMFFGINRARQLRSHNNNTYFNTNPELSENLKSLLIKGTAFGINSIVWSEGLDDLREIFDDSYFSLFNKRIAYKIPADKLSFVEEKKPERLIGKVAAYLDANRDVVNTHFRPFELPNKQFVSEFANSFNKAKSEE